MTEQDVVYPGYGFASNWWQRWASGSGLADGHEIIERNWRTRYCEIDIVSIKDDVLWFTEVKYRKNDDFGSGLEVITTKK